MTQEEFIETVSKLPGVGKKKAEALYEAGFTTVEKLKAATAEELQKAEGVGPKVAQAILDGLKDLETPAAEPEAVEVVERAAPAKKTKGKAAKAERKAEAEEKPEVVEPEAVYRPKIKPELTPELKRALDLRAERRDHEPEFSRYHRWHSARIPESWRAPKGTLSKQRRGFKYRPPRVKVGYGKPAAARHLHPSGFEEVLVANPDELALVADPKRQAARIVGTVGARKRKLIEEAAAAKNIRILNPTRRT